MPTPEYQNYRDRLAAELKAAPKELRKAMLDEAAQSSEYIEAFLTHNRPRMDRRRQKQQEALEAKKPDLTFNFEDEKRFQESILALAEYVYSTMTGSYEGDYDPYKGHMLCGEITDKFITYLKSKNIEGRRISRTYEIKAPNGEYNDSFGHVYLIIDRDNEHIFIDPTWLQWVEASERTKYPPVLIIRYRDIKEFKTKFKDVPIKKGMVLPFYLGFDSEEAQTFFKQSRYTIRSEECARIDD